MASTPYPLHPEAQTAVPDGDIDQQLRQLLPRLRRFAHWLTRDTVSADDLVQSTLERALSRWHSRRDANVLRAWLFAIAYRQFLSDRRRARRYAAMLELFGHGAPDTQPSLEREFIAQSTVKALERLPEEQRLLLLWVSVEGLSYREVADLLHVPIGTVMSRLSRARAALHQLTDGDTQQSPALKLLKPRL